MHFTIVIPTYKRRAKIHQCIDSILKSNHKDYSVYVLADNNDVDTQNHIKSLYSRIKNVHCEVMSDHVYVAGCWNWFTSNRMDKIKDAMVWLVDDVELFPDTLSQLEEDFQTTFPDKDGVVGIRQECPGQKGLHGKPYGQVALGKKFIERYPDNQVCCPDYIHFYQDEEMYTYATSIKKFRFSDNAKLVHYHPAFLKECIDPTHSLTRGVVKQTDIKMRSNRVRAGYNWGNNFDLIGRA